MASLHCLEGGSCTLPAPDTASSPCCVVQRGLRHCRRGQGCAVVAGDGLGVSGAPDEQTALPKRASVTAGHEKRIPGSTPYLWWSLSKIIRGRTPLAALFYHRALLCF